MIYTHKYLGGLLLFLGDPDVHDGGKWGKYTVHSKIHQFTNPHTTQTPNLLPEILATILLALIEEQLLWG